jgi:hypothetical protein
MTFITARVDDGRPDYASYLFLLVIAAAGTLSLTSAIEKGIEWWQHRRLAGAGLASR